MARKSTTSSSAGFPIGVVSRMTGIHPETLRIWERRYGLVHPARSGRNRTYSQDDVQRLTLVKALTDAGHAVGSVATLPVDALQALLQASAGRERAAGAASAAAPSRVVVLGEGLAARFEHEAPALREIELLGAFGRQDEFDRRARALAPDVLLLELPTVQTQTAAEVRKRMAWCGARCAVLAYGFGARRAVQALEAAGVMCLRAPVTLSELQRACLDARSAGAPKGPAPSEAVAARRFSPEQLARIAFATPSIACECPRHLVDLVTSLSAFETYSAECESRNARDAEMHRLLQARAAAARALIEEGLARVVEFEGIKAA